MVHKEKRHVEIIERALHRKIVKNQTLIGVFKPC